MKIPNHGPYDNESRKCDTPMFVESPVLRKKQDGYEIEYLDHGSDDSSEAIMEKYDLLIVNQLINKMSNVNST